MKRIYSNGTPFEISIGHGEGARTETDQGLVFYQDLFLKTSGLSWSGVCDTAARVEPVLQKQWPQYCGEMHGKSTSWNNYVSSSFY